MSFAGPFEYIQRIDIETASWSGDIDGKRAKSKIAFPSEWLRERSLQPENCRVIDILGESMEPTLPDGCSILIHLLYKRRRSNAIYLVWIDDELVVKRAVHDRAGWLLVNDNPDKASFPTLAWPGNARMVGEAVSLGQSFAWHRPTRLNA